ncbi:MAG: trehalose-phosphatase [Chloroflexota bacterium]|nr:MAG: trehalose-phosphatase [Chloroflexota bacterium]
MTIWQQRHADLLDALVQHSRLGLVADFDGTLSPIAPTPDAAQLSARNRELLALLRNQLALVGVVSGRGVRDLRDRVGLDGLTYIGNHGLERWVDGRVEIVPEARSYRPALEAVMAEVTPLLVGGTIVEDKDATISIHYRLAEAPDRVQATLGPRIEKIAQAHGVRFFEGHRVFELRPPVQIDKGTAFRGLIEEFVLDAAVFIGDDTTDADALRVARELRSNGMCYALGVGVEASGTPASVRESADFLLPGVPGVEEFLSWLSSAASASDT